MGEVKEYLYPYDDPYKVLVSSLVEKLTPMELLRVLKDDEFLERLIRQEVRGYDFAGPFADCVFLSLMEDGKRMEFMRQLDRLVRFYFVELDTPRFRGELTSFLEERGIVIE